MATARETINTGLEALRVLGFGQSPTSAQAEYCLKQLNAYIAQLTGFGGSLPLMNVRTSSGYDLSTRWPAVRVQMVGGGTIVLPKGEGASHVPDGMRVHAVDASETAASSNIVIDRNGWLIDGAASNYTISTNGGSVMLMFRADLGDWIVLDPAGLGLEDDLPFPADFDEAIALNAAIRYTRFGQRLAESDAQIAERGRTRLRARYTKPPAAVFDSAASAIGGCNGVSGGSVSDILNGID